MQNENLGAPNSARNNKSRLTQSIDPAACIASLREDELSYPSIPASDWLAKDALHDAVSRYPDLWWGGKVVWGRLVQANGALFSDGSFDAPGEVLYDPSGAVDFQGLEAPAQKLGAVKNTQPTDPMLAAIAHHLTSEYTRARGMPVPDGVSQRPLLLSTVLFHRGHFPDGKLSLPYFPLLINDQVSGVAMVLPCRWWPVDLVERWQTAGGGGGASKPVKPATPRRHCGNCREPMRKLGLAAHYKKTVEIDVCEPCSLIWFDDTESARLAGPGIADLVRIIHGAMQRPRPLQPLPLALPCPVCGEPLKRVSNISRFGRTAQLECIAKHGAFQSFALFLAEKGYFRPFTWADIKKAIETGKSVTCFNCGAKLESRPHDECPYCKSPVGVIDPARLASAIDVDSAAPKLQLVPVVKQSSCPCCGGGIDLTAEMVCPHCMAVVRPVETQAAVEASDAVAQQVRGNYLQQSTAVSRRKLDDMTERPAYRAPRGEGMRRWIVIVLTLFVVGKLIYGVVFGPQPITHIEFDENNKKVGLTSAQYEAREKARRETEMAKVAHAPDGVAPPGLELTRDGNSLKIVSLSNQRLSVEVYLAYEQIEGLWLRCRMVGSEGAASYRYFLKFGDSHTLLPQDCKEKILDGGNYEFQVWDMDKSAYIFKSDSAFF